MEIDFHIDRNEDMMHLYFKYDSKSVQIDFEDSSPECERSAEEILKVVSMAYRAGKADASIWIDIKIIPEEE